MRTTLRITALTALLLLAGCGRKPSVTRSESERHYVFDTVRLAERIDRSLAIQDRLRFYIAPAATGRPECDSICDRYLQTVLRQLNAQKSSGTNGYQVLYDGLARQLEINVSLAETLKRERDSSRVRTETRYVNKTIEVPVPYTPLWMKVLAGIGGATAIYLIYRLVRLFT